MNRLLVLLCVVVFVYSQTESEVSDTYISPHNLVEGNCTGLNETDLKFAKISVKKAIPLIKRSDELFWQRTQNETIFCILARGLIDGSTVDIIQGGVGEPYVHLNMQSSRGKGVVYEIQIFAK